MKTQDSQHNIKFALNGILHAEQHDLIPVVNFDNSIRNFFYEESYGENTWEYYFEPLLKFHLQM